MRPSFLCILGSITLASAFERRESGSSGRIIGRGGVVNGVVRVTQNFEIFDDETGARVAGD
jgi:hypothetical protein